MASAGHLNKLEAKIQEQQSQLEQKTSKIEKLSLQFDAYLKDQENEVNDMKAQFEKMEALQKETQARFDSKKTEVRKYQGEVEYLKNEKISLQKKINEYREKILTFFLSLCERFVYLSFEEFLIL